MAQQYHVFAEHKPLNRSVQNFAVHLHASFYVDRLRGFSVARGRILAFSIDLLRRLYNTLAYRASV